MSWVNSSSGRQQQQQVPPPASTIISNNNVTTPIMAQTSSATFGQQQWQSHNKQNFQQHPPSISTLNHSNSNSNWLSSNSNPITTTTTISGSSANSSQYQHINWQEQNLSSPPLQNQQPMVPIQQSVNSSFVKQQSQSNVQQLTDNNQFSNYQQQNQQQYQQNFSEQLPQIQNQQFQQNYQQSLNSIGKSSVQNHQIKSEQMSSTIKNQHQDNEDKGSFSVQPNDGWDDWDWNDNNNQSVQNQVENQNIIDESFKTEPNDNWQWDVEEKPSVSNLQVNKQTLSPVEQQQQQHSVEKKSDALIKQREPGSENTSQVSLLGSKSMSSNEEQNINPTASVLANVSQNTPPSPYGSHHAFIQTSRPNPVAQTVHSSPVNQHQRNVQALDSNDNCQQQPQQQQQQQQNTISNAVYVSQAKPVSQPTRQYAMSPPLAVNQTTPVNSSNSNTNPLPSSQPPTVSNRKSSLSKLQNTGALPPYSANSQSPGNGNFPLPPPPSQTPPDQNSNFNSAFPPPPPINQTSLTNSNNPYKRAGQAQHHRSFMPTSAKNQPKVPVMPSQFFAPPPEDFRNAPPPKDFQNQPEQNLGSNQECLSPDNSEVVDRNFEIENFEIAPHTPNDDRNQYLQTSHLSEEGFSSNRINENNRQESNYENDNFPPPGLSRLVLGQPEVDPQQNSVALSEIPPGLDRMVPGTELATSDLNMERQADGQDTMPSPRSAFLNVPPVESSNIDVTSDRNLYLVAGESDVHEQRVVTGVENGSSNQNAEREQRELEMDGENLEDQQHQQQHHDFVDISRDEPIEGANTLDAVVGNQNINHETESSLILETNVKDHSNISTGNEESDNREKQLSYFSKTQKRVEEKKRRNGGNEQEIHKRRGRYETEDSDLSSDRERRKYKEGNSRSERDKGRDSKEKERRDREKREESVRDAERGRYREEEEREDRRYDRERNRDKYDRNQDRGSRYDGARYETDSKYETESSVRYERRRGDRDRDRNNKDYERDYDRDDSDYRKSEERDRRYYRRDDRDSKDRDRERDRDSKRRGDDEEYYLDERRQRRRNRDRVRDRDRERDYRDRRDRGSNYDDDYNRKGGSRNARDSDRDKDRTRDKDSRYSHMYGYPSAYGYDPYAYYQQQQQYYEQLRRTNPQLYAEWYRKYFGGHQIQSDLIGGGSAPTTDGRESVHSGRSSANDKQERYSLQSFHPYFQQQHTPSDYHRQQYGQLHAFNLSMHQQYINEDQHSTSNLNDGGLYQQQQPQQQQQQQQHLLHSNRSYNNYMLPASIGRRSSSYAPSDYSESRPDNLSINLIDGASVTTTQDPQRLTPCKFVSEHAIASLSAGIMICVKPKYIQNGGITNIVKILKIGANDSTRRLFQTFPGPLVRGLTHKKTIIEFCEDQIRLGPPLTTIRSRQNSSSSVCSIGNQANKASFTLMWNLLILLLRQNGMVVGTDIAELLMKNKQQFPYEIVTKLQSADNRENSVQSNSKKSTNESDEENDDDNDSSNSTNDKDDQNSDESDSKISLSEEEITEKFRNYLLYGNVNEALDWATDNNLWGHALFLASKVDRRLHANVMMKFANKLSLNDPLQTLYQLMSGRTPSSVTSVQDEKWGDWRPHLAMILSNTSQRPELDRKAITTLGDSLYNRGDLFGAQFCYLMAQVGFNKYSAVNHDSTLMSNSANVVRLVLLGSSQHKPFREFATNEAIMMTEIYEYACALNDDKFCITEFQPYKYLLANRMLDYGLQLKTLMYMEQISLHIQRDPSKYDPTFIKKIYDLGDRLKFFDPVLEKTVDDQNNVENSLEGGVQIQDQKWLQDLKNISNQYCTENHSLNEIEHKMINAGQQGTMNSALNNNRSQIDQQFAEINQQFSELNLQYNNFDPLQSITPSQSQQQQLNTQQEQQHQFQTQDLNQQVVDQQHNQYYNPPSLSNNQQQQQGYDSSQIKTEDSMIIGYQNEMNFAQSYDQQQQQQDFHNENNQQQMTPAYDYWSQQQPQQNEIPRPTISMPNSLSNKPGFFDDTQNDTLSNQQQSLATGKLDISQDSRKTGTPSLSSSTGPATNLKTDNKNQSKSSNQSNTNSGWFGGIWNKLSLKPKNQMILPDDKNPTIVWDPEKKKWVNTEGEENEQESFKPPPKMSDLMPAANIIPQSNYQNQNSSPPPPQTSTLSPTHPTYPTNPSVVQHQSSLIPTPQSVVPTMNPSIPSNPMSAIGASGILNESTNKTPSLQSNIFKMQRNRTLKKSYVDVFNPSGASSSSSKSVEPVLAPVLPPVSIPQSGYFVPSTSPTDDTHQQQSQQQQQQQQSSQENVPQFYNPNQFSGY